MQLNILFVGIDKSDIIKQLLIPQDYKQLTKQQQSLKIKLQIQFQHTIRYENSPLLLKIWNPYGSESFNKIKQLFLLNIDIVIIVFDYQDKEEHAVPRQYYEAYKNIIREKKTGFLTFCLIPKSKRNSSSSEQFHVTQQVRVLIFQQVLKDKQNEHICIVQQSNQLFETLVSNHHDKLRSSRLKRRFPQCQCTIF